MTVMERMLEIAVRNTRTVREISGRCGEDLRPTVLAHRGEELVAAAQLFGADQDRDQIMQVARAVAVGFEPDLLVLAIETWFSELVDNPLTGLRWQSDEMQGVYNHPDNAARGWVAEAVLVNAVNRAGDQLQHFMPYRRVNSRKVEWLDGSVLAGRWGDADQVVQRQVGGVVPDALKAMMAASTMSALMFKEGVSIAGLVPDYERRLAIQDVAVATSIMDPPDPWLARGFPTDVGVGLLAAKGGVRWQVIKEHGGANFLLPTENKQM